MFSFKKLEELCSLNNVTIRKLPEGHLQLKGSFLVNYYPYSKNKTAYVNNTKKSIKNVSEEEAVLMAVKQPEKQNEIVKRKSFRSRKRRAKLHRKGINNCHWCNTPLNLDTSTLEHIIPLATNGLDHESNWTLACAKCNNERGDVMSELGNKNE